MSFSKNSNLPNLYLICKHCKKLMLYTSGRRKTFHGAACRVAHWRGTTVDTESNIIDRMYDNYKEFESNYSMTRGLDLEKPEVKQLIWKKWIGEQQ